MASGEPVAMDGVPSGAAVRYVPGTVLPGLVDAHVHTALVDVAVLRAGGLAGCDDLGGVPAELADLRERSRRPGSGLPHVDIAGAMLTAPGGYPSGRGWARPGSWREVRSVDDAQAAVAEQVTAGAGRVKIALNALAGPVLPVPVLRAVVAAAQAAGCDVVVHAEGRGMVRLAVQAGADVLAHTPWTERLDAGLLAAGAERMVWISTLDIHGWGAPTADQARDRAVAEENLGRFVTAGGRVRYGTDLGNGPLPPGVNRRELEALSAVGLGIDGVLAAITDLGRALPVCVVPDELPADVQALPGLLARAQVVDA